MKNKNADRVLGQPDQHTYYNIFDICIFKQQTMRSVYVIIHKKKIISNKSIFSGFTCNFSFEKESHFQVKENDINARYGIFGMDKAASTYIPRKANTIYSIYVRRKDYDTALLLLHSSINN